MKASSGLFNGLGIDMYRDTLYAIPAGYRVAKDIWYYDMIENGGQSTADVIMGVWNSEGFKETIGPKIPACEYNNYEGGWYEATSLDMCIRPDETSEKGYAPLIVDLYIDILYPSKPLYKTPVMLMSATQTQRTRYTLEFEYNSHLTGYAFDGITAAVHDHHYVPMARDDHYGYYSVNVPGNYTTAGFSLIPTLSSKVAFAALRCVKYYADTYGYDGTTVAGMGISKGSPTSASFINPDRDWLKEFKTYSGNEYDEIGPQPFLTYDDGTPIDHNVVCTSTAMGHGTNAYDYFADTDTIIPTMIYCGDLDQYGNYNVWPRVMDYYRKKDFNHIAFTMYDIGHYYPYGYDSDLGFNRYEAFNSFNKYHLLNEAPSVLWMTPHNNEKDVDLSTVIKVQFVGAMDKESMQNGAIVKKLSTGEAAKGEWISACGGTEFTFVFENFEPCEIYEVNISKDVKDIKGKYLEEAYVNRFKTKGDKKAYATDDTYIDKANEDTNYNSSGLFISAKPNETNYALLSFDDANAENAYKVDLNVLFEKSDENQVALVYGINGDAPEFSEETLTFKNAPVLDADGNIDLTKVYGGTAIGSVSTDGVILNSTLDVTDYILSLDGKTPRFILASEFVNGVRTNLSFDNEDGATRATTNLNVPYSTTCEFRYGSEPKQAPSYTTEMDHTANGGGSIEMIMYPTGGKARSGRIKFYNSIVSDRPLESRDIGRTFETSFWLYTESTNAVEFGMMSATGGGGDNGAKSSYTSAYYEGTYDTPTKNTWQQYTFSYTVDQTMVDQQIGMFVVETMVAADGEEFSIFVDDVVTKEITSDINIVSKESKTGEKREPSLILFTENKEVNSATNTLYVDESKKDKTNANTLYIQGANSDYDNDTKKGYFGFDISDMTVEETDTVKFKFYVNTPGKMSMNVYGVDMGQENFVKSGSGDVHNWSESKMHYLSAPANDRNSEGVDLSGVYGKAPLATLTVNGVGFYEVDITEYVKYMKSEEVDNVTLIFTPNEQSDGVISTINYENKESLVWEGNTSNTNIYHDSADYRTAGATADTMVALSTDVNHTPGGTKSLYFKDRTQNYNRLKLYNILSTNKNLTTDDIGRKFKITLYAYTEHETSASLRLGIMAHTGGASYVATSSYPFEKEKWVKCEYIVTVNDLMVNGGGDYVANAGFLTVETDKKLSSFYIDDITCEEVFDETRIYSINDDTTPANKPAVYVGETRYEITKDTYIANGADRFTNFGTRWSVAVGKSAKTSIYGDEKVSYIKFASAEKDGLKNAVLSFDTDGVNTVYIGGVKGNIVGNETWNTMVSYPVKKLYSETVSEAKNISIDVTDYIKTLNGESVFEIKAIGERGNIVYENDFETMSEIAKETDFRQGGQASLGVAVTSEKAKDGANSLKLSGFNISYGRLKLFNVLKSTPLNTNDIGRKFRVKLSLNPSSTGVTRVDSEGVASNSGTTLSESTLTSAGLSLGFMANIYGSTGSAKGKIYDSTGKTHKGVLYTKTDYAVNEWTDVEFVYEIDESAVTNNVTCLIIQPSGMTFAKDVYVDNIVIEEITGISNTQIAISNPKLTVTSDIKEEYKNTLSLNPVICSGGYKSGDSVILTAVSSSFGADVKNIEFYNGNTLLDGNIISNGATHIIRLYNLSEGTYNITAKATYSDGEEVTSDSQTFTIARGVSYPVIERSITGGVKKGSIDVVETVKNNTLNSQKMIMVVAIYDNSDNLIKTQKCGEITVGAGEIEKLNASITDIGNNASYAKIMLWDGFENLLPLKETVKIN